jgi:sulfate/thiosulfate transport system ATP-binding protein
VAENKQGERIPTVIADELHIVYRVNGAKTGKGSATAALSRILKRGEERGVRKVHAVRGVSFVAYRGEAIGLIGSNGSGKSTLLRAIAGLDQPDTGTITINGRDVTGIPPQRRGIGFVFQHYAAFKHLTVRDNVAFGLKIRKRPKAEVKEKVDNLLEVVGLAGFQTRYPNQLSGGQRQRMALARALAVDPEVLLLDEPFGALDAKVREDLRAWLRRLHDEVHVTTVLVTHDQAEALDVADRIAVLNKGRIEQVGSPTAVYDTPANAFVMSFLGAVSSLNGSLVRPHDIRVGRNPEMAIAASDDSVQATGVLRATIDRIVMLGFEVRVELTSATDQTPFTAQITRGDAEALGLKEGDTVYVRATRVPALPGGTEIPRSDHADEGEALTKA